MIRVLRGAEPEDLRAARHKHLATTIAVLGLRRDIPETVSAYVRAHVQMKMERLRNAVARNDRAEADLVWKELEAVLVPGLPYLAATYDAIDWFLDHPSLADVRAFMGRVLPRPGAVGVDPTSDDMEDPPLVRGLPDRLRLQVRAEAWENAKESILALCAHASWEVEELVAILGQGSAYITRCCRSLAEEHRLAPRIAANGRVQYEVPVAPP